MAMDLEYAIDELYTSHVSADVRNVADVRREVHYLAEYMPGDSDASRAAHAVLQVPGAVEHLAQMILAGRAAE
jgi:hypothetical protein